MAIRFTPEYNARIRKIVGNYNRRVSRAKTEGKMYKSELPEKVTVSMLKQSYSRRADLEQELRNLESFKRKSARQASGRGALSQYDLDIIKSNRNAAIKHFEHLADTIRAKAKSNYPLQKDRLNAIERNLDILRKGPEAASDSELVAMERYIDKYRKSFERQATGYRGFLNEVDLVMNRVGIEKGRKQEFFDKLSKLNEQEFYDLYEKSDLVSKIYELADSPKYTKGKLVLHESETAARELIDTLLEEADILIAEVKQ